MPDPWNATAAPEQPLANRKPDVVVPIRRVRYLRYERPLVYFRFPRDEFRLSLAGSDEVYRSTPHIAINSRTSMVVEVGPDAHRFERDGGRAQRVRFRAPGVR